MRAHVFRSALIASIVTAALAFAPAWAATNTKSSKRHLGQFMVVMHYLDRDGSPVKVFAPLDFRDMTISLSDCQTKIGPAVAILKKRIQNGKVHPNLANPASFTATCEIYSDALLTTVK